MQAITLFNEHVGKADYTLDARIEDGSLQIIGHDQGADIIKLYGSPEHEFSYTFTPERTRFLHYRLRQDYLSDDDLLTLVRKLFGGPDGEKKLRQYCRSHNIPFEFHDSVESIDQIF
jgi:hypothetical protein